MESLSFKYLSYLIFSFVLLLPVCSVIILIVLAEISFLVVKYKFHIHVGK